MGGFGRRKQTKARSLALSKIESLNQILQHNYFFSTNPCYREKHYAR